MPAPAPAQAQHHHACKRCKLEGHTRARCTVVVGSLPLTLSPVPEAKYGHSLALTACLVPSQQTSTCARLASCCALQKHTGKWQPVLLCSSHHAQPPTCSPTFFSHYVQPPSSSLTHFSHIVQSASHGRELILFAPCAVSLT